MNDTQKMLEDSVTRLFSDLITREALTRIEETTWDVPLWQAITDLGLPQVLISEAREGMGGSWVDAFLVARACGRHAVPAPVPEQMLAGFLCDQASLLLPAGIAGVLPAPVPVAALKGDNASFSAARVPWGRHADFFVGLTEAGHLVMLSNTGVTVREEANLAREPRDHLTFEATPLIGHAAGGLPADSVRWLGALLRSAQISGAAAACLELSVKYTSERVQFGRALSQFQAIQHHLAEIAGEMASVDTMAMVACRAFDARGINGTDRNARFDIAVAKCRASEAVEPITRLSHQVHGAIGFTYEYDLQFLTRRLWSWRAEFGAQGEWGKYLGGVAMDQGGDQLWPYMTA